MLQTCKSILKKHGWLQWVLCAVCGLLFFGGMYVIAYHNAEWWRPWLPTSINNDEVMYNRQLAGVLTSGQPRGYFGYNETHAPVGHFGAWGPIVIYLYAIPGVLFGTGCNTMLWCNISFAVVGWIVFVRGTRLSWKKQIAFALGMACLWLPLRLIFSGMSEPSQYFLVLMILGASVALQRQFRVGWFGVLAVACALTTITRAYTVLLWIFPIVILWKKHRRWAVTSIGLGAASLAGYLSVTSFLNSPYFSGGDVDFTALEMLLQGNAVQSVQYEIQHVETELSTLWQEYLRPTLTGNPQDQGCAFLTMMVLVLLVLFCTIYDAVHKRPVVLKVCALLCTGVCLVALLGLYTVGTLHRHCSLLNVLLLAVLVYENAHSILMCLPLVPLLVINTYSHTLPTYRADIDAQIQTARAALTESWQARASEDPWDSTLAYAYADGVFHGFLYAVPDGMGIQFDMNTYIADETQPIYSRYAMVNHGTDAEARLLAEGWQQLVSTEKLVVYERPDAVQ